MSLTIKTHLFAEPGAALYATLDGASIPDLVEKLAQFQPEHEFLMRDAPEPDMRYLGPYLVRLEPESEFTDWVIQQGWGHHWGVCAASGAKFRVLCRHFRRLLTVEDSKGRRLHFRYYDPRVLRVYLPTCNAGELGTVFGPVTRYVMESERPGSLLQFRFASGGLQPEVSCW